MTFTKPTIVKLGTATEAIQSVAGSKVAPNAPDMDTNNQNWSTNGAYSIDE